MGTRLTPEDRRTTLEALKQGAGSLLKRTEVTYRKVVRAEELFGTDNVKDKVDTEFSGFVHDCKKILDELESIINEIPRNP